MIFLGRYAQRAPLPRKIMQKIDLLGVSIACLDQAGLVAQALDWAESPGWRVIHYANAHSLNLACEQPAFRDLLNAADLVYADGVSLSWASRLLHRQRLKKLTGADWLDPLCVGAASRGLGLYLLGGHPGIAEKAAQNLLQRHPSLKIVGTVDGFFQQRSPAMIAEEITRLQPQLVLVGLGAPLQEQWIAKWKAALPAGVWWGVGALLDFAAGAERRVPGLLYRLGLEWLWRLAQDPAGKWRRYVLGNPRFVARVLMAWLIHH